MSAPEQETLPPPVELPEIAGAQTIELCATVAVWQNPRATVRGWLVPLIEALTRLTRPTAPKVHVIPQLKLAGLAIHTPEGRAIGLGESVGIAVTLPLPPETRASLRSPLRRN